MLLYLLSKPANHLLKLSTLLPLLIFLKFLDHLFPFSLEGRDLILVQFSMCTEESLKLLLFLALKLLAMAPECLIGGLGLIELHSGLLQLLVEEG